MKERGRKGRVRGWREEVIEEAVHSEKEKNIQGGGKINEIVTKLRPSLPFFLFSSRLFPLLLFLLLHYFLLYTFLPSSPFLLIHSLLFSHYLLCSPIPLYKIWKEREREVENTSHPSSVQSPLPYISIHRLLHSNSTTNEM